MELTQRDKRVFSILLKHPELIDWKESTAAFQGSGEAVYKSILLIPKNSESHLQFHKALLQCFPHAKYLRYHWLVKALASVLEPDENGNSISPLLLMTLKEKRKETIHIDIKNGNLAVKSFC